MAAGIQTLSWEDPEVQYNLRESEWLKQSGMGYNMGYGSVFDNPLSPFGPASKKKQKTGDKGKSGDGITLLSTGALNNEIDEDGIVPKIYSYGTRVYPKHAALPFTLLNGNVQTLHCVFALGWGPLGIYDLKIGDKPISDYGADIEYEIRAGSPGDAPLTLFTQDVNEDQPNEAVLFGSKIEAFPDSCNYIGIDLVFPQGLYNVQTITDSNGVSRTQYTPRDIGIYVEVHNKAGTMVYGGTTHYNVSIQGYFTRTIVIPGLTTTDDYQVTIERSQVAGNGTTQIDTCMCVSVKGIRYGSPLRAYVDAQGSVIPQAFIALKIKGTAATAAIQGAFNCRVHSFLKTWNGSDWVLQHSGAPADIVADLLCSPGMNPRPIPRSRLNGPAFALWKYFCEIRAFRYSDIITEEASIKDLIDMVCFTGCGLYVPRDSEGKHSVVIEQARETVDQYITPLNSRGFKFTKTWGDLPHAIKGQWVNNDVQDETIIPRDPYTQESALTFESKEFRGVYQHDHLYKLGRYHWADTLLRPTTYEWEMAAEYMLCGIGSRVKVTNDMIGFGLGAGRVRTVNTDVSGNCISINVSQPFEMATSRSYAIRIRFADGTSLYRQVKTVEGFNKVLVFSSPIASGGTLPEVDDLVQYGYLNQEADLIISEITPTEDLTATIQAKDYAPGVYTARDTGVIPPYSPPISVPERARNYIPPQPVIKGIMSDESVMLQYGTTLIPRIKVLFGVPASSRITSILYAIKRSDEDEFHTPQVVSAQAGEFFIANVQEGATYAIQLVAVADNNYKSDPVEVSHEVTGKRTPPPEVSSMYPQGISMVLDLPAMPIDYSHVQIRINFGRSSNWDQGVILIPQLRSSSFPLDLLPDGLITVMAKTFDTSGNESVNHRYITHDFGATLTENVYLQDDSQPLWENCTITNGTVVGGEVWADDTGSKFWSSPGAKFWSGLANQKFWTGGFKPLTVQRDYVPRSDITEPWLFKLDYEVDAENYHVFIRTPGSGKFWSGAGRKFWSGGGNKFWSGNGNEWRIWNGERIGKRRNYSIKIECPGSTTKQAKIKRLGVIADMPDITENFSNTVVGPGGTSIALTKVYRQITSCITILQSDAAYPTAATVQLISPLPYTPAGGSDGPMVKVFDAANAATSGKVAGSVKGW